MVRFFFRKIFPILLTLAACVGGFLVYNHYQPTPTPIATPIESPTTKAIGVNVDPGKSQIHPGIGAWVTQFDRTTGLRTYRFKSDRYDNHPNGSVDVTNPVIEFFQPNGQIIHIEGIDGVISMPANADKGLMQGAATEPPRNGFLRKVICKMFASEQDQKANLDQMTLTMDNAQFDNDTYRLFTQQYLNDAGQTIDADKVPVKIVGKDYDFDGTGLIMYWNDPQKQLKSLEIAHGKQLTIKNTSALSFGAASSTPSTPTPAPPPPAPAIVPAPVVQTPVVPAPAPLPRPTPVASDVVPVAKPRYYATFNENVRVLQGGDPLVLARQMYVDFQMKSGGTDVTPPVSPPSAPAPAATPIAPAPAPVAPTPMPPATPTASLSPPANTNVVVSPAPAKQDIKVLWDGKLTIVPTPDTIASAQPLDPGQSIIHLVGEPVVVHGHPTTPDQPVTDVRCADLVYKSVDSSVRLAEGAGVPLTIIQRRPDGSGPIIRSQHLQFSKLDHRAVLEGIGSATFPDPNDPKSTLLAKWQKKCIVNLIDAPGDQMQIQSADLDGNVDVTHPKFHLTSDELQLTFDPAGNQPGVKDNSPQLRRLVATGNANVDTIEAQGQSRSIQGSRIQLDTAEDAQHELYAKTVHASGSVTAKQADQDLQCNDLLMDLLPAAKKPTAVADASSTGAENVALQRMVATDNVHVKGKDGSAATCDSLLIEMIDGHENVTLIGKPYATVLNKETTLSGPIIHVLPGDQLSTVDGAGVMDTVQQPTDPTKKAQPMHVWWADGIKVDGKANRIDVNGDVNVESHADDGSINLSHSEKLILTLEEKPPTTQPAPPAAKPAAVAGGDFNFMQNKQVQTITLLDKAQIQSTLTDAGGALLKRFHLAGRQIIYAVDDHRLTVPVPGRMLAEEHAPPSTQPAPVQPDPTQPAPGGRGATAFEWARDFVYDELRRQAVFEGDVHIIHRDDGPNPKQMSITGDRVVADLQPTDPAVAPQAPANNAPRMQVSHVTVIGNVKVISNNLTITAGSVDYDPVGQLLICRAGDAGDVKVTDDQHSGGATFSEVWLNTKTNALVKMTDLTAHSN
jgi:lipopolysaccharide export system protein LptA